MIKSLVTANRSEQDTFSIPRSVQQSIPIKKIYTDGTYLVGDGGGTVMQHDNCREISWSEAQPGDLVFYADDSHVGIVGGQDEHGNWLIIHCAASPNNVVISQFPNSAIVVRPLHFG